MESKPTKLEKTTCEKWKNHLKDVVKSFEDCINNGIISGFIKDKKKDWNFCKTDDELKNYVKSEYEKNNLKNFDWNSIENRPLFLIHKGKGTVGTYETKGYSSLEDVKKINFKYNEKYIYERVIYDYSKAFFDLDFNFTEKDKEGNKIEVDFKRITDTLNYIDNIINNEFKPVNEKLKIFAYGEYNKKLPFDINKINVLKQLYPYLNLYENEIDNFKKLLSIHIYIKGICFKRSDLKQFMEEKIKTFTEQNNNEKLIGFDATVYKNDGSQQIFRLPYSGKFINKNEGRKANPKFINAMIKDEKFKNEVIENCVICADCNDILFNYIPKPETKNKQKQNKPKPIGSELLITEEGEGGEEEPEKVFVNQDVSIFNFMQINGKYHTVNDFINMNHFEFGQSLYFMLQGLPLSEDEFYYEIKLVFPVDEEKFNKFKSKFHYMQDFSTLDKLFYLKQNIKELIQYVKQITKLLNKKITPADKKTIKESQEKLKIYYKIKEKLIQYINKYKKECFIENEYYDIKELKKDENGETIPMMKKIFNNCFKTVNDDAIYYVNENNIINSWKNLKAMANALYISPKEIQKIYEQLTCFDNQNEFIIMKLQKRYNKEPEAVKAVADLLEMLRASFSSEEDYKWFLSWLSYKITKGTTNYRSIMNQNETETGHDALKTFVIQILNEFIEVKTVDVRNLNKNLNGSYLTGQIAQLEELPRKIKEQDALINTLKEYTHTPTFTIEEKGDKPRTIKNRSDFIINTNHDVSNLFYNKADAEALSKRFRILNRVSIDTKKYSATLDKYHRNDPDHFHGFCFYMYLKDNKELLEYYEQHRNDKSKTELKYIAAAVSDTVDKIEILYNLEQFKQWLKSEFMDKNHYIKIGSLTNYFKNKGLFKDIKQATLKQQLLTSNCLHVEGKFNKMTDAEIENLYNKYFEYVEELKEVEADATIIGDE